MGRVVVQDRETFFTNPKKMKPAVGRVVIFWKYIHSGPRAHLSDFPIILEQSSHLFIFDVDIIKTATTIGFFFELWGCRYRGSIRLEAVLSNSHKIMGLGGNKQLIFHFVSAGP